MGVIHNMLKGQIYQESSFSKSPAFIHYSEQVLLLRVTCRLVASLFNHSINDQHKSQDYRNQIVKYNFPLIHHIKEEAQGKMNTSFAESKLQLIDATHFMELRVHHQELQSLHRICYISI